VRAPGDEAPVARPDPELPVAEPPVEAHALDLVPVDEPDLGQLDAGVADGDMEDERLLRSTAPHPDSEQREDG
jgi:hypothetical protein